jgi:hypothetical protein
MLLSFVSFIANVINHLPKVNDFNYQCGFKLTICGKLINEYLIIDTVQQIAIKD